MSQENVEVVREAFEVFNGFAQGEASEEAIAALADPEFEYDWPAAEPGHHRGVPAAFAFIERVQRASADLVWEPLAFTAAPGDRVLAVVGYSRRDRESGMRAESQLLLVFTIRDGRVRKVEFFRHRDEAIEAAGLAE
jgi:ketosteroid isomerase-like protein